MLTESIGIETLGGVLTHLIAAGEAQEITSVHLFSTSKDNQPDLTLKLYRGNGDTVPDGTFLGDFRVAPVPPAPRGIPQIEITFSVANSCIELSAKLLNSTHTLSIEKL
ncbi:Hsp70 family protein [Myxococcota bacterium]|nr:Hsp70 family protein [Myxococcota bacterium]